MIQPMSFADKVAASYLVDRRSIRDIAAAEGRSFSAIRDILLRNGVELRGRGGDNRPADAHETAGGGQ